MESEKLRNFLLTMEHHLKILFRFIEEFMISMILYGFGFKTILPKNETEFVHVNFYVNFFM